MAEYQSQNLKLPILAVTIPVSTGVSTPAPSITTPTQIPASSSSSSSSSQFDPSITVPAATSTTSTPSGMHSPPLSNTGEDEEMEMNSAVAAAASVAQNTNTLNDKTTSTKRSTQPWTDNKNNINVNNNNNSNNNNNMKKNGLSIVAQSSKTITPLPTTVEMNPSKFHTSTITPTKVTFYSVPAPTQDRVGSLSSTDKGPGVSGSKSDDLGSEKVKTNCQLTLQQTKEKTIQNVLKQGKILKMSRRLRTRLEYAILKIRRGWSKYTLQEVESLIQPGCSPRLTVRQFQQTISRQSSPRLSDWKSTIRRPHSRSRDNSPYLKSSSDPDESEVEKVNDLHLSYHSSAPSTPSGRFRSRMPSLSQYKDSELFQPAKSLMEIATSKPEPGYSSPRSQPLSFHSPNQSTDFPSFHRFGTPEPLYRDATPTRDGRWSGYSTPVAPSTPVQNSIATFEEEAQDGAENNSAAQVARTILMLSSPTRPPPRSLNQNYLDSHSGNITHAPIIEWTAPYSPSTSSPLVQFQTNASSLTPSPDQTPALNNHSGPSFMDDSRAIQRGSPGNTSKSTKQPSYTNLYEPSSPSPLSTALFPSSFSNDHLDRVKTHSRSSSPTLKRAVRFASILTNSSDSSRVPVDILRREKSNSHYRSDYNGTVSNIYPEPQPGYEDNSYGPALPLGEDYNSGYININGRSKTPPPITQSYPHFESGTSVSMGHHGMRTPPSSGGKDLNIEYSMGGSIPRKRRNSGPLESPDLPTMFRHVTSSSPNLSSTNVGTASYRR